MAVVGEHNVRTKLSEAIESQSHKEPGAAIRAAHAVTPIDQLQTALKPLFAGTGGIDSWISAETIPGVVERLLGVDRQPLSRSQLNQLLLMGNEVGVSPAFFDYYWLKTPPHHPYDPTSLGSYDPAWTDKGQTEIISLAHLRWGLERLYTDSLLYFGTIRTGYRFLRGLSAKDLEGFFTERCVQTQALVDRGAPLPLLSIAHDDRHLVAEMACKSLDNSQVILDRLNEMRRRAQSSGRRNTTVREVLAEAEIAKVDVEQLQFLFGEDDMLEQRIDTEDDVQLIFTRVAKRFDGARQAALANTELYLSMVGDMDVYVATSMRTREDFRKMARFCDDVFGSAKLKALNLRYFDPTLSAAAGHEDKGLIECLMVKCADVLVYCSGTKESLGKDFEAAMALSQGKLVIFFCDEEQRRDFYRDVHPLTRLIDFNSGVAVGALATTDRQVVIELLHRHFTNRMEYQLEQSKPGYLRLRERLSGCTARLQTSSELLRSTFWNYYHSKKGAEGTVPALGRK